MIKIRNLLYPKSGEGGNSQMNKVRELFIEVTNHCYQKCIHCSSSANCNGPEIPFQYLKQLIDKAIPIGLESVTLSGGEPFLYPDLQKVLKYLKANKLHTSIYTCGVIKNKKGELTSIPEEKFAELVHIGLERIIFSLHGQNAEVQNRIANTEDSFDMVIHSLDFAIQTGVNVELHIVPMQMNLYGIEDILKLARGKGITKVSLLRFVPQGRGSLGMEPSKADYLWLKNKYPRWEKEYPEIQIRMGTPYNCLTFDGKNCTAGQDKLLINAYGEYMPCEAFKYMHGTRPTIYDTPIEKVWVEDSLLNALRHLRLEDVSICSNCPLRYNCKGGCPGQRMHRNGNLLNGPDPSCIQELININIL